MRGKEVLMNPHKKLFFFCSSLVFRWKNVDQGSQTLSGAERGPDNYGQRGEGGKGSGVDGPTGERYGRRGSGTDGTPK